MSSYQTKLEQIRRKALHICSLNGDAHEECIEAWETLDVLEQIEESVYEVMVESLDRYCSIHPEAEECRLMVD